MDKEDTVALDYSAYDGFRSQQTDRSVLRDTRGVARTQSLFLETQTSKAKDKYPPLYSLSEEEREDLPSAYQIYMNSTDEYEAAMKLVGSMRHWRKLCELKWFMEGINGTTFDGVQQWREDMKMRDASTAKAQLLKSTKRGDSAAARKILETATGTGRGPGAPKKEKPTPVDNGRMERLRRLQEERTKGGKDE